MDEPSDDQKTIDRLLGEVRQVNTILGLVKQALNKAGQDFHLLTLEGAISLLIQERNEAIDKALELEKELQKLIRSSK